MFFHFFFPNEKHNFLAVNIINHSISSHRFRNARQFASYVEFLIKLFSRWQPYFDGFWIIYVCTSQHISLFPSYFSFFRTEYSFWGWTFALKEENLDGVLRVKGKNSMKSVAISVNVWFILLGSVVPSTAIESSHQHSCCVMSLHFHTMYVHCQKVLLRHPQKNGTNVLIEQPAAPFEFKLN